MRKIASVNERYTPVIVNTDAKKYPYLSINKGLMIWDDYFAIKTASYMFQVTYFEFCHVVQASGDD